ncbi:MAG: class I SAM-dependent methyltransferase, partial [Candidatus Thorarchaeota archaeon]
MEKKGDNLLRYCVAAFDFIYAYAPLFENLEALLKNEKKYDVDVFRRGRHVAKATAEVSQFIPLPVVESIIKEYNFKKVLDLGCGSAEFLIQICSKTDIYGLGVDISEDAVKYACEMIGKSKANGKVSVVVDDIFNFEMSKNEYRNVDLITSMFVMHEFLNTGKQTVINLLKRIKSNFPDTH